MPQVNSVQVRVGTRAKGQNVLPIAFRLPQIAVICQRINNYVEKGEDYLREERRWSFVVKFFEHDRTLAFTDTKITAKFPSSCAKLCWRG